MNGEENKMRCLVWRPAKSQQTGAREEMDQNNTKKTKKEKTWLALLDELELDGCDKQEVAKPFFFFFLVGGFRYSGVRQVLRQCECKLGSDYP